MNRDEYEKRREALYEPYAAAKAAWEQDPQSEEHKQAVHDTFDEWNEKSQKLFQEYTSSQQTQGRRTNSKSNYPWYIIIAIALIVLIRAYVGTLDGDQKGKSPQLDTPANQESPVEE